MQGREVTQATAAVTMLEYKISAKHSVIGIFRVWHIHFDRTAAKSRIGQDNAGNAPGKPRTMVGIQYSWIERANLLLDASRQAV